MLESNYNDVAIPIKSMQNATKIVISNFFIVTLFPDLFSSCLISVFCLRGDVGFCSYLISSDQ